MRARHGQRRGDTEEASDSTSANISGAISRSIAADGTIDQGKVAFVVDATALHNRICAVISNRGVADDRGADEDQRVSHVIDTATIGRPTRRGIASNDAIDER